MLHWPLLIVLLSAEPTKPFTSPKSTTAEFGHGLTAETAQAGWISLFDGRTTFGWTGAKTQFGQLGGGKSTTEFGDVEIEVDVVSGGKLTLGRETVDLAEGQPCAKVSGVGRGAIRLEPNLAVRKLAVRPLGLTTVLNGEDLSGWKVITRAGTPAEKQAKWNVEEGAIRGIGGPGALELQEQYANLVLQMDIRTRAPLANGGVFFRSQPGLFMMGYEAQVFNACYDGDPAQPAAYSTGGIDDRQLPRRLVSRDWTPYTMTVIAVGPHISIWINGVYTADWTDTRAEHESPRSGLRLAAGTIQLQMHDPETDVEFKNIRVVELK